MTGLHVRFGSKADNQGADQFTSALGGGTNIDLHLLLEALLSPIGTIVIDA